MTEAGDSKGKQEIEAIKADIEYLKRLSKNNRRDLDINSLTTIAFVALFGVASLFLLSLKRIGSIEVAPLESLRVISEVLALPAIGALITAVITYTMKRSGIDSR